MSVTSYNNIACKYRLDKLDKVVYLFNEEALRNIKIDNGNAYVSGITQTPLAINCYAINLQDTDELDERYKFTHTLTFSVNGYVNYKDFQGRYYVVVKSLENEYWLVNPLFPCKVTYTYNLTANDSHTDFTLATASNHPTLRVIGMSQVKNYECGYRLCGFKGLKLNEKKYSVKNGYEVQYSNAGFDDIHFDKNSQKFTEQFDGTNVSHQIDFNIKFDDYKSSWHYNLLEFTDNLYSAIIYTTCGKTILTGFHFGLQPSFTVSAESDQSPNNIQITLVDMHNDGNFIGYYDNDGVSITKASGATYEYTTENGAYECVSANTAMYILKREVDRFGNPTGNYICLEGYEDRFADLNIVDTFAETETFVNPECSGEWCNIQTSIPSAVTFNTVTCRMYTILGDSDWTLSSSSNHITVRPTSGAANEVRRVEICNTMTPTSAAVTSTISISYCSGLTKTIGVTVISGDSCFQAGSVFDIDAHGQYVTIPTQCCIDDVTEFTDTVRNITIQDNYIRVYVPTNNSGTERTFYLDVTMCDNTTAEVIINQSNGFERWVYDSWTCDGAKMCEVQRKYTGLTADNINTWTSETRLANCEDSLYCSSLYERWIDSPDTTCSGGKKYTVQIEQTSSDGNVWVETGNKRLGVETDDSPAECSGATEYEDWREDGYFCEETTKYKRYRLYTSTDEITWYATDIYKSSDEVLETNSKDCGYYTPTSAWTCTKWDDADGYICEETTKYAREELFGRMCQDCNDCNEQWVALGIYRRSEEVLEEESTDCGFVIGSDEWTCDKWENDGYICDDTTKYVRQQRYVRMCSGDCSSCAEDWIATGVYRKTDTVIETNSTDCGYIIPSSSWTCSMWSAATGYICDDGNKYAREQLYGRMCQDCNNCSEAWTALGVYRRTDTVLEYNSTDCGYDPTISGNCTEYRDVGETICDGYDEYKYLRKYVRNCEDCDNCYAGWNATNIYKRGALIKTNSFNCGYIPLDTYTKWEEDGYICDSYNKYARLRKYISEDNVNWYETDIYKRGELIEENSEDCGYIYPISGDCTVWYFDGNTICEGVDKYEYLRKMVRNCPDHDCEDCDTEWHTTNVYKRGELLEHNSFDCGYLPIENYYLWRYIGTICDGYNKYERLQKYISEDGNKWYATQIFKKGQLLEENSADCGYAPPQIKYEYRWVLTDNTICG